MPVSRVIATVSVVYTADAWNNTAEWKEAIKSVSNQEKTPIPSELHMHPFTEVQAAKKNLRRLSDAPNNVRLTTWGKYPLPNGVQKYTSWYTMEAEFFPKVAGMAGNIITSNPGWNPNQIRVDLSNQVNRLLGMNIDKQETLEGGDVRTIYSADVPILQAEPEKETNDQPNQGFFRPCMSSSRIDTSSCQFTKDSYDWIKNWVKSSWDPTGESPKAYPFTGEGYTYNWNEGQDRVGLQEFVVPKKGSELSFHVPNHAEAAPENSQGMTVGTPIVKGICDFCTLDSHKDKDYCQVLNTDKNRDTFGCSPADTLVIV